MTSYCCPPNVLRTIAEVNGFAYSTSVDAVWVNLYGGNKLTLKLNGEPLRFRQTTDYPWNGRVRIAIDECPEWEFAVKLRIPAWAESATIRVNGQRSNIATTPGSYATTRRKWNPGDVIELDMPMPARLIEANPLVEEARNQVAIERGPIVYCLESPDLPKGVRIEDVTIPADAELTSRFDPKMLGGVTVIETTATVKSPSDWSDKLYRPLSRERQKEIRVRFIPYFAWSNRGASEMSVWVPVE
jgi:DUF1680 family protein